MLRAGIGRRVVRIPGAVHEQTVLRHASLYLRHPWATILLLGSCERARGCSGKARLGPRACLQQQVVTSVCMRRCRWIQAQIEQARLGLTVRGMLLSNDDQNGCDV
jgi:hypothetical protein